MQPFLGRNLLAVFLGAAAVAPCGRALAGGSDVATDVDRLLRAVSHVAQDAPSGDSPTALLQRLLGKGKRKFVAEMKTRWGGAREEGRREAALEYVIRFAHGRDCGDPPVLREQVGVVLIGEVPRGDYDFGSFGPRPAPKTIPTFATLIKGGKVRRAPKPNAGALLKLAEQGLPSDWKTGERRSFFLALGEACGRTGTASERLISLAEVDPTSADLSLAVAWSRSDAALSLLRRRVRGLSERVGSGRKAAAPLLRAACSGLHHISPEALVEEVVALADSGRDAALGAAGFHVAVPILVSAIDAATDDTRRRADCRSLHRLLIKGGGDSPAAGDVGAVLARLRADLDDGALRNSALQAADTMLYAFWRHPVGHSANMNGIAEKIDGENVGAYPSIETLLRALADDAAAGRVVFGDDIDAFPATRGDDGSAGMRRPRSKIAIPMPNLGSFEEPLSIRLEGQMSAGSLVLTITNDGPTPVVVNPIALRYGTAEWTTCTFKGPKIGDVRFTNLALRLGFLRVATAATADALTTIAKGETFSWTIALREEHRDADHISVELQQFVRVAQMPAGDLIDVWPQTWVK